MCSFPLVVGHLGFKHCRLLIYHRNCDPQIHFPSWIQVCNLKMTTHVIEHQGFISPRFSVLHALETRTVAITYQLLIATAIPRL